MGNRAVIKFGGEDLATGDKIKKAAKMVHESGYKEIVVVVSAIAGTTNSLLEITSKLGIVKDQDYAEILSMGERTSVRIFCSALRSLGAEVVYLEPTNKMWPIITDSNFKEAKINIEKTSDLIQRFVEPLLSDKIVIVCGFLGVDDNGNITTLGRGGSDTTAMVLANSLRVDEVILVKETEGVMSADPKIVKEAKSLKKLDIREMFALSCGGAKIIKANALMYKLQDQKLRVVNFSSGLLSEGTQITGVFNSNIFEINEKKGIMSVSLVCNIEPENVSKILTLFRNRAIYGISTGRVSLTVFTSSEEPSMLINELHNSGLCKALSHRCNIGLIELTHPVFVESPGWIASISNALSEDNINIIEITTSKSTINIFIDELKIKDALKAMRYKLES